MIPTIYVFKDGRRMRINESDLPRFRDEGWSQADTAKPAVEEQPTKKRGRVPKVSA